MICIKNEIIVEYLVKMLLKHPVGIPTIVGQEELPRLGVICLLVQGPSLMDEFLMLEFASAILE